MKNQFKPSSNFKISPKQDKYELERIEEESIASVIRPVKTNNLGKPDMGGVNFRY
jgi:hypothetical protein